MTERFAFGKNWLNFLKVVNPERIQAAERSLQILFQVEDLKSKRVLDVGCGSGLFSLAANRLGAGVYSFDYDPDAVACTKELKRRYAPDSLTWEISRGSALDNEFLKTLGQFDIVYSWGVLHHTGSMWQALENVHPLVAPGGLLGIAIYNDQGGASQRWAFIKRYYNRASRPTRFLLLIMIGAFLEIRSALIRLTKLKNPLPMNDWKQTKEARGMSTWYDLVDWVGGFPFEVAKPEEIFSFYFQRSYTLIKLKTCGGGLGCNEYVFKKHS